MMQNLLSKLTDPKNREGIAYLFWGGVVTVMGISLFKLFMILNLGPGLSNTFSTVICVTFAYISNKFWVFHAKTSGIVEVLREMLSFFAGRFFTYVLETALLIILIDTLHLWDTLCKIFTTALVIALNYLISKLLIFKTK